jgi:uncharacterized protein YhaN
MAEEAEEVAATLERQVNDYARASMALEILRRGMECYRDRHQGGMVRRAGELFSRLTRGSFDGLRVDVDGRGNSILFGLRAGSGSAVELAGMSDGTCDQLYLALRIAGLEEYLATHQPMPFIVDDVLVNFDEQRALAALETFAELSEKTQVIFFTHHQHLVELARGHLPPEQLFTHELEGESPAKFASPNAADVALP